MATPAHPNKVYVRSDATAPGAPDELAGIDSWDFSPSIAMLDATDFKDTSGAKKKLAGLTDGTIGMSGKADLTDAPQNLVRSAALAGTALYVTVHPNPTGGTGQKGYQVQCLAKGFKLGGKVDNINDFSGDLEFNGAPVLV